MAVGRERKTGNVAISPKNTKTGDFNMQRTLSGSFFVIPERFASIRVLVLAFTANKQTNKQTNEHSQLYYTSIVARLWRASLLLWPQCDSASG